MATDLLSRVSVDRAKAVKEYGEPINSKRMTQVTSAGIMKEAATRKESNGGSAFRKILWFSPIGWKRDRCGGKNSESATGRIRQHEKLGGLVWRFK
jgi:hypothetical protein